MDYYGFAGTIVYVDLSSGEVRKEPLDVKVARDFIGGVGINYRLAYDLIKPGIEPLSPESPIIIGVSALAGTNAPGTPKFAATFKHVTGTVASAVAGMNFGCNLKWAGYDHLIITGKAEKPVYLKIVDDDVEICDAKELWGKSIGEATEELYSRHKGCSVIAIGQAGENLVRISEASVDRLATLGRGGLGAVMGSKNLKALVALGTKGINVADRKRFKKLVDSIYERVKTYPLHKTIVELGLMENFENYFSYAFATKNFTGVPSWERTVKLFGPDVYRKIRKRRVACNSCFCPDKDVLEVREGKYTGLEVYTPSYLNTTFMAVRLGIEDVGEALMFTKATDEYGLDSAGLCTILDFLMDLYERGIITEQDTDGLPLRRGDIDNILMWVDKVAFRQDFGTVLADGWLETIRKIGKGCEKYALIFKGMDTICLDPRLGGLGGMEFEYVVGPRPHGPNCSSATYMPGVPRERFMRDCDRVGSSVDQINRIFDSPQGFSVGRLTKLGEDWWVVSTLLGICTRRFINRFYTANLGAELYSAATGIEISRDELMKAGERVWNMLKALNVREGFSRKDDVIPERWFEPLRTVEGKEQYMMDYSKTRVLSRDDLYGELDDYYDERGWDKEKGIPTKQKLIELGLSEVAEDLYKRGLI